MKRLLNSIVFIIAAAVAITGCGNTADFSKESVTAKGTASFEVAIGSTARSVQDDVLVTAVHVVGQSSSTVTDPVVLTKGGDNTWRATGVTITNGNYIFYAYAYYSDRRVRYYGQSIEKTINDLESAQVEITTADIAAGNKEIFKAESVAFKMSYVPGGTFPTGTGDTGTPYAAEETISTPYWVAETEVTYELWHKVYTWATSGSGAPGAGQYTFGFTSGSEPCAGNDGAPGSETTSQEPVTMVNWRHAMAWCNALTEWYNAQNSMNYSPVYYEDAGYATIIRSVDDTGSVGDYQDAPFIKSDAKGFRLLTSLEWECAARYKGSDSLNGALERPVSSGIYWTPGAYASGATANYMDDAATIAVAVVGYIYGGGSYPATGVTSTAVVKSKTTGYNGLGLYDMSGNVWEWCFDWHPEWGGSYRVYRGGSWGNSAPDLRVGNVYDYYPYLESNNLGFRFSRTQ